MKKVTITLADLGDVPSVATNGTIRTFLVVQQVNMVQFKIGQRIGKEDVDNLIKEESINVTIRKAKDSDF